jgi:RimK-like ATP-grasp domain
MLELRAIAGPTGRLLKKMLQEKGLLGGKAQGRVNYGYAGDCGLPTLNVNAGRQDKYHELIRLDDAGVRTIPFSHSAADLKPPIFGRKFHHTRGTDIFVYGVRPLLKGDHLSDYYTQLVSKANEFRVWVFRDKTLASYEKTLDYPAKNGRRGRNKEVWNWANGYAYHFVQPNDAEPRMKKLAVRAVDALGLDFGAVDIMLDKDDHYYVLEVNTAPGVEGRRQGLTSLVNCIERWAKNGFPEA